MQFCKDLEINKKMKSMDYWAMETMAKIQKEVNLQLSLLPPNGSLLFQIKQKLSPFFYLS